MSFFPQLVAGPIERAKDLVPQFLKVNKVNYELLRSGLLLMLWGFFKKIVIADRLAIFVDGSYGDVAGIDGVTSFYAVVFFAFQLYIDFSAYSDIAIGSSKLLGFNLSTNFKRPYLASSFSNFWKRWHISLSSWFKDYVYIPLGGSRTSKIKFIRNILVVFMLSGLWHGASWNFVLWGLINGVFILIFDRFLVKKNANLFRRVISSFFISTLWALSLVLFRAETLTDAISIYGNLFNESKDVLFNYGLNQKEFYFTLKLLVCYMVFELILEKYTNCYTWFTNRNFILRWALYISALLFIIFYGSYGVGLNDNNFIYFQF